MIHDWTIKSNSAFLYTLVVKNRNTGKGTPVAFMLTTGESQCVEAGLAKHILTNYLVFQSPTGLLGFVTNSGSVHTFL
jgi:hypothetical protein